MRGWVLMLGGLLAWTAHFFVTWAAASIFLTSPAARLVTAVATIAALAATWALARASRQGLGPAGPGGSGHDRFAGWSAHIALLSALTAGLAILWQVLPALLI